MANGAFVSYCRVSTAKQGASGLGLDAQQSAIKAYLNGGAWRIVGEFVEVESGKNSDRPELAKALAAARLHRAALVVAKVDRLTRSSAFLHKLLDAGVDVRFCDLPQIEGPTGRFMLQQMAAVAELEAGMIADRTKKALASKKQWYAKLSDDEKAELRAKGKALQLGGRRSTVLTADQRALGRNAMSKRAASRVTDLGSTITELRADGASTLKALAAALNARSIPAARGGGWSPMQVSRVLARLDA